MRRVKPSARADVGAVAGGFMRYWIALLQIAVPLRGGQRVTQMKYLFRVGVTWHVLRQVVLGISGILGIAATVQLVRHRHAFQIKAKAVTSMPVEQQGEL